MLLSVVIVKKFKKLMFHCFLLGGTIKGLTCLTHCFLLSTSLWSSGGLSKTNWAWSEPGGKNFCCSVNIWVNDSPVRGRERLAFRILIPFLYLYPPLPPSLFSLLLLLLLHIHSSLHLSSLFNRPPHLRLAGCFFSFYLFHMNHHHLVPTAVSRYLFSSFPPFFFLRQLLLV